MIISKPSQRFLKTSWCVTRSCNEWFINRFNFISQLIKFHTFVESVINNELLIMSVLRPNADSSYELTEENLRKLARRNQRPLKCKFCFRNFKYRQVIVHHLQKEHSELIRKILKFKIDQGKKSKAHSKIQQSENVEKFDENLNRRKTEKTHIMKISQKISNRRASVIKENPNHSID